MKRVLRIIEIVFDIYLNISQVKYNIHWSKFKFVRQLDQSLRKDFHRFNYKLWIQEILQIFQLKNLKFVKVLVDFFNNSFCFHFLWKFDDLINYQIISIKPFEIIIFIFQYNFLHNQPIQQSNYHVLKTNRITNKLNITQNI